MSDDAWGFADMYALDDGATTSTAAINDVTGDDWRNILVLGRATPEGIHPETLALVGRARYLADELGCRVEVLLIGDEFEAATKILQRYPINTIYRVRVPPYAPIDAAAKILETVVRKRRPELVLAFQSRSGDAVVAYAASRLGVGHVLAAVSVSIDTSERRARALHIASNTEFQITTEFQHYPQFVSVQRGLFRAPMEDPYASVQVHDLDIQIRDLAKIVVVEKRPPPEQTLRTAQIVVIAGARVASPEDVVAAQAMAYKLGAAFGVTRSVRDRGLADGAPLVGISDEHIAPRLLFCVGVRGTLDFLEGVEGEPIIAALGAEATDPIAQRATYLMAGSVKETVASFMAAL
jgi:electron transfer flavoprotein alpha subunit